VRVTTSMYYNDILQNIQQNTAPLLNSQEELSTGLRMNKPSDDPADLGTVMSLQEILDQNISEAGALTIQQSRLAETDSALGTATNILNRAYTLVEEADNTTTTGGDSSDIAREALQLLQEMVDTANETRGTGPQETFFSFDAATNTVSRNYPSGTVSEETLSHDTVDPNAVFWDTGVVSGGAADGALSASTSSTSDYTNPSVFQVLQNVYNDLANNPDNQNTANGTFTKDIAQLQDAVNSVTAVRAQVGAMEDRLQTQQTQITNQNLSVSSLIANFKDIDVAQATVQFSENQAAYQATLETSSIIMQISLTNYLQL